MPHSTGTLPYSKFWLWTVVMLAAWTACQWPLANRTPVVVAADEEVIEGTEPENPSGRRAADMADDAVRQEESFIIWLAKTSGAIGVVLLVLSVSFVATVVNLFVTFRPEVAAPPERVEKYETLLRQRDTATLYRELRGDKSFYGTVVIAGLSELPAGLTEARDAMDRTGDALTVDMEKRISMLAVLGSLGPMIGLLGTLKGMIASFSVIAISDTQLNASKVAEGISEALVLTFEGVGLSVPAIYFFAVFRNRVSSISSTTMLMADEFIRRINSAVKAHKAANATANSQPA